MNTNRAIRTTNLPGPVRRVVQDDKRIRIIRTYDDGWVPNAYHYPAPGTATLYTRKGGGWWSVATHNYDRKRSGGRGPCIVGYSERGGRLAAQ